MFGFGNALSTSSEREIRLLRLLTAEFGGVQFDLRAPELPSHEWEWPRFVTERARGHNGIHIAGDFDDPTPLLLGGTAGEFARECAKKAEVEGRSILFPGDRVCVTRVRVETFNPDPFALPPDREGALAWLRVERPSGEAFLLEPIVLFRRGCLLKGTTDVLGRLEERRAIMSEAGQQVEELERLAERLRAAIFSVRNALAARKSEDSELHQTWFALGYLDEAVNLAAEIGYWQGRLEAASAMEPLARHALDRQQQAREAGRKNAKALRLDYATSYWLKYPEATVYEVARAYLAEGNEDAEQSSVERSIKKIIPPTSKSYKRGQP